MLQQPGITVIVFRDHQDQCVSLVHCRCKPRILDGLACVLRWQRKLRDINQLCVDSQTLAQLVSDQLGRVGAHPPLPGCAQNHRNEEGALWNVSHGDFRCAQALPSYTSSSLAYSVFAIAVAHAACRQVERVEQTFFSNPESPTFKPGGGIPAHLQVASLQFHRGDSDPSPWLSRGFGISEKKAEVALHLATTQGRDGKGPAVQILRHPFSLEQEVQERCTQGATQMRPSLTPVQTRKSKPTP